MRVAITGASGFVGGRIAAAMTAHGHDVFPFGRREASLLRQPLANYRSWDMRIVLESPPDVDVIVHCAALVGDWGHDDHYRAVNVDGTARLLETYPSTRVVYVSSSSVYSDSQPAGHIPEGASTGKCRWSAYSRTKAAAEHLVLAHGQSVVLRPHIIYGPGDTTLLPRLIAARRFGALIVPGDGRNELSVTHVNNLVDAVIAAAVLRSHSTGAYNIADARTATVDELLRTIFARLGMSTRLVYLPTPVAWSLATASEFVWPSRRAPRGPLLTRYLVHQLTSTHVLDISRAQAVLGYSPGVDYTSGPIT